MATAKPYIMRQYPAYDLTGNITSFLGAINTGCFKYRDGPPSASEVPSNSESRKLPPWTLLRRRNRGRDEGESSQPPTIKRARTEVKYTDDSEDEGASMEDGSEDGYAEDVDEEDPEEEEPEIVESEDVEPPEEEGPRTESSELAETEFISPLPVGPPPEIPPPPSEPFPEDLQQPLHPVDQAFYTELYERMGRYGRELADMAHVRVAPAVAPEPPEPIVIPVIPEELLSPIGADTHGSIYWDPVWIRSDLDSEEEAMEDEGWVHGL